MELKLQPADMSGLSGLRVLIVPYGIEMANNLTDRADIEVLIVPYGIEIRSGYHHCLSGRCFNRTLWN